MDASQAEYRLKVIVGELTDSDNLSDAIKGQDVVISLLGPTGNVVGSPFTDAYHLIFNLMNKWNVKRIYVMGTPTIKDSNDAFSFASTFSVFIVRIIANSAYHDILNYGKLFENEGTAKGIEWTIFRLGFLTNGKSKSPKAGYVGKDGWGLQSDREDVVKWLVNEIDEGNREWIRKRPAIYS